MHKEASRYTLVLYLVIASLSVFGQQAKKAPVYPVGNFSSEWISHPTDTLTAYGVYHLRKNFTLDKTPQQFYIHVTADHRYRLYVNGTPVCSGSARGDFRSWYYETIDIAPWLKAGKNVLAATVWNMGVNRPQAQMSIQTGFNLQGDGATEKLVNTDTSWRITRNAAYYPAAFPRGGRAPGYTTGDCDSVVYAKYPFGWEQPGYDDSKWLPVKIEYDVRVHLYNYPRHLVKRPIPLLEENPVALEKIVRYEGLSGVDSILKPGTKIVVPPDTKAVLLFDQGYNTIGYPELNFSGGVNSTVKIAYAEALYDAAAQKGNRNEIAGKKMRGIHDFIRPDGGAQRLFRPLWLRTYRYLEVEVQTQQDALVIDGIKTIFSAYPFEQVGKFTSNEPDLEKIWDIAWRTIRVGSLENFVDGPAYEQLQYGFDGRIQAIISLYGSGDDRLMCNMIDQFNSSRIPEGLTMDSYPRFMTKIIPTFSLMWVATIHDHFRYRYDPVFTKKYLLGIQGVLEWFENRVTKDNLLGPLEYWNFVDWSRNFKQGVPPDAAKGNSAVMSLIFVQTLEQAAEIFEAQGSKEIPARYRKLATAIKKAVYDKCYDPRTGYISDTPDKIHFSQHAQLLAVLTDCIPAANQEKLMQKMLDDTMLSPVNLGYRYHLNRALVKAGLGNEYLKTLAFWKKQMAMGLTTFPETDGTKPRSDCHGWSATPVFDLLSVVCGVEPAEPGFKSVLIRPHLGDLQHAEGVVPHPKGTVKTSYQKNADGSIACEISLPAGVNGKLQYGNKDYALKPGTQKITLR